MKKHALAIKITVLALLNAVIGYYSALYLIFSYAVITNTSKGRAYYNPEGESLRFVGVIMFLAYAIVLTISNMLYNKYFLKTKKWRVILIELLFMGIGGIVWWYINR